ncbi:type II toxin-antitoxin system VapC family toxin [Xylophilus sp.]|uniref:type II toxin-antitoxin system VapC family toxin n=1 Tax=Xylophilus sp. TaxID=2653893 RepID=UPI0013BDCFF0|nr:type II toxin-antitoxin system VapC family toxin [Xylophilus sp.]KAF1048716.1 MAG: tRNA(fMet)-specific endonuclease VapC [Xylophilus sp.]
MADEARRIALDTNVLARYLPADDEAQAERAARLLESGARYFVPVTVGLELAWVLRSAGVAGQDVLRAFRHLHGLPGMAWQHAAAWQAALRQAATGFDIADARHLALSADCDELATFDDRFAVRARRLAVQPPATAA